VIVVSSQAGSFIGASAAFVVGIGVSAVVTMATAPKPEKQLVGLVWSLTPRESMRGGEDVGSW
jgi:SSS family solute:Na+ symporter